MIVSKKHKKQLCIDVFFESMITICNFKFVNMA